MKETAAPLAIAAAIALLPSIAKAEAATWIGGTGNWTDAANWSTGDVPGLTTNVVIDGDENAASVVTVSSDVTLAAVCADIAIDAGDALSVYKAKTSSSSSQTVSLQGATLDNRGTISLSINSNKKNNDVQLSATNPSTNHVSGVVNVTGYNNYSGCDAKFALPVDGSVNNGEIRILQPLRGGNTAGFQLSDRGRFVNNGLIELKVTGADSGSAFIHFTYGASSGSLSMIDGTGEIFMNRDGSTEAALTTAQIYGAKYNDTNVSTHTVTNGPNHTIRGTGSIHTLTLVNAGLVRAEGENGGMLIRHSSLEMGGKILRNIPGGRMVAAAPGGITLGENESRERNAQFINEGLLEARTGSSITFAQCLTTSSSKNTKPYSTILDLSGTLAGGGTFGGKPMRLLADATLSPGDLANTDGTGASTAGTLTFATNLTLSADTTLDFQLGSRKSGVFDAVVVEGELTLAGTLRLSVLNGAVPSGTYRIFTCAPGQLVGDETSLTVETVGGLSSPKLFVDAAEGTVDAFFPPQATVFLVQ